MKKALIIGATSRIGKRLTELLIAHNYYVAATGRKTAALLELQEQFQEKIIINAFDINFINDLTPRLNEIVGQLGGLDLLVICSGVGKLNEDLEFDIENEAIITNITAFTCIANWAFKYLVKQKSGHLVALTSVAGLRGGLDSPAYNASKAYQINYLQALQIKADRLQIPIFVTDVRPGYIDSNPDKIRSPWVIELEDAIQHIFIAIKKKKKIVYISKRWRCIGFILRIMTIFR